MTSGVDFESLAIVVYRKKGQFLAKVPELGLYATGQTLHEAVDNVERKKQNLLAELQAADCLDDVALAQPVPGNSGVDRHAPALSYRGALSFAAKVAVVVIAAIFAGSVVSRQIRAASDSFSQMGGANFWRGLETELARAADPSSDISPAKKQVLLSQIHIVVERWRPFVREASLLFSEPPPATEPAPASK